MADGWKAAVEAHCERFLGPCPHIMHEIVSGAVPLDVYPHLPTKRRDWITLRTGGVSELPTSAPDEWADHRRIELFAYLPADWPLGAPDATPVGESA